MLQADITINAPPRVVRDVYLDFDRLPTWHTRVFFEYIKITTPGRASSKDLQKGDRLKVRIPGVTMNPEVIHNEPDRFCWLGTLPLGLLAGYHDFFFKPDPSGDPNKTFFRQEENFSGLLGFMFAGNKSNEGWVHYNEDIKAEAERVWAAEKEQGAK